MQAILTKVLPVTNTKPTRIKASCARGSIIVSYDFSGTQAHKHAVRCLIEKFSMEDLQKYRTPITKNPWGKPFVSGQLANGNYAHVFIDEI